MDNNKSDDIKEKFPAIISSGIKSLAASFPGFASFAAAWNEWESEKRWNYFLDFVGYVDEQLDDFKVRLKDQNNYISSEEAPHLFSLVIEKVQREHREEKRKRFAKFFLEGLAVGDQITFDEKRYFLELLDELNNLDFRILQLIYADQKQKVDNIMNIELDELVVCLSKLLSKGLIAETSSLFGIYSATILGDARNWDNLWRNKWFEVLPIGKRFLSFI